MAQKIINLALSSKEVPDITRNYGSGNRETIEVLRGLKLSSV